MNAGDRVRVTYEGVVEYVGMTLIAVDVKSGQRRYYVPEKWVEVIESAEPEWQIGDIVIDREGTPYRRAYGSRWRGFDGVSRTYSFPARPLTLLVRDGKPVTP